MVLSGVCAADCQPVFVAAGAAAGTEVDEEAAAAAAAAAAAVAADRLWGEMSRESWRVCLMAWDMLCLLLPIRDFALAKPELVDLEASACFGVVVGVFLVLVPPVTDCLFSVARLLAGAEAGAFRPDVVAEVDAGASCAKAGIAVVVEGKLLVVSTGVGAIEVCIEGIGERVSIFPGILVGASSA